MALGKGRRGSAAVSQHTKIAEGVFAEGHGPRQRNSLPRAFLCRGPQLAALGKEGLCRVPEIWPSAKPQTLGKERVSSSESSSASSNHCFFPCLESLQIDRCDRLTQVANLPPSIKTLQISDCQSLVSLSGEVPSLEKLVVWSCESLESLPNGPANQAYSSLRVLDIRCCSCIKQLPQSLQQRLGHLEEKYLEPHLLGGNLYSIS